MDDIGYFNNGDDKESDNQKLELLKKDIIEILPAGSNLFKLKVKVKLKKCLLNCVSRIISIFYRVTLNMI